MLVVSVNGGGVVVICQTCKDAGNLNHRGLGMRASGRVQEADALFDRADDLHYECRGCDCQHTTRIVMSSNYHFHVEGRPE